jgi:hypothetical protein
MGRTLAGYDGLEGMEGQLKGRVWKAETGKELRIQHCALDQAMHHLPL